MLIDMDTLLEARWPNVRRLGRSLGVYVPRWCSRRRRRFFATRIMLAIYPPVRWSVEVEKSAAGASRR